jgi:cob(I)alamin adenosyltransferase
MVILSRICTKTGDDGTTGLANGQRVPKNHPRIVACGVVDELNAVLGVLLSQFSQWVELLRGIQNDLFDLGADLSLPQGPQEEPGRHRRVQPGQVQKLETVFDQVNEGLSPLPSFVLPGGSPGAAWCHLARTICRRAEREIVALAQGEPVNPQVPIYLNRLSDLLFVLARWYNEKGEKDLLWVPGNGSKPGGTPCPPQTSGPQA